MKASMVFLIAGLIVSNIGFSSSASAQDLAIETSSDDHDGRFFGEGVLQIVVTSDDAGAQISIEIEAEPDAVSASSVDVIVPETNEGSDEFELFLAHIDATAVGPADLDPDNSAGVEGDGSCIVDCAPFVTFGPGGDIDIDSDLYEDVRFKILAGDTETTASYEETTGSLELDRDSYGTNSFMYISVIDQDANLNPTERDEFTVDPSNDPNADLLVLNGGTFEDAVTFRETGDNTGVFEARYELGESILASGEILMLTLFEKANYGATLAASENDSNDIDERSFRVGNSDGSVVVGGGQEPDPTWDPVIASDKGSYVIGETVYVTITDPDANAHSGVIGSIQLRVSSGTEIIEISAIETGFNTGIFEASFALVEGIDAMPGAIVPGGPAIITYTDMRPANYSESVQAGQNPEKDFTLEIDIQLQVKTGTEATEVTAPASFDAAGGSGPYSVGDSVTLSTSVSNNNYGPQPFLALIEVRDASGITVFLALQGGTLEPSGEADIGVLWQPDHAGTFEVRTFVLTSIGAGGEVLSSVASSEINVI